MEHSLSLKPAQIVWTYASPAFFCIKKCFFEQLWKKNRMNNNRMMPRRPIQQPVVRVVKRRLLDTDRCNLKTTHSKLGSYGVSLSFSSDVLRIVASLLLEGTLDQRCTRMYSWNAATVRCFRGQCPRPQQYFQIKYNTPREEHRWSIQSKIRGQENMKLKAFNHVQLYGR